MRRTISRLVAVLAVAVVAGFGLAGCGSGDQTASTAAQATSAPTSMAATTAPPTTAAPATTAAALTCATVSFSSDSEDVATQITSTGLSCADAEAFVRTVGPQLSSPTGPARVDSDGFSCVRVGVRSGDHGPPLGTFECTNGAAKVIFNRALVGPSSDYN